jgi:nucleoside-diphosphate-sugar epimerase
LVDLTHIDNAAWAHVLAAEKLSPGSANAGKAYFISDGQPVNLWTWIGTLLNDLGLPPVARSLPLGPAFRLGSFLEWVYRTFRLEGDPPLTRFVAYQLALPHYYDIGAAERDFGYRPLADLSQAWSSLIGALARPASSSSASR